jgi:hypothetical protein
MSIQISVRHEARDEANSCARKPQGVVCLGSYKGKARPTMLAGPVGRAMFAEGSGDRYEIAVTLERWHDNQHVGMSRFFKLDVPLIALWPRSSDG